MADRPEGTELAKVTADDANGLEGFWQHRNIQWALDRSLLLGLYKQRVMPFEMIISNEPAVLHQGTVAILGGKPPLFRLPITVQDQAQVDKMNRSERMLYGIFREVDNRWRRQGNNPWLNDFLYYGALGAIAVMPWITKKNGRDPEFRCNIIDPMQVYPEYGENGIRRLARSYETTYAAAISMAQVNGWNAEEVEKKESIKVTNWWEFGRKEWDENPDRPHNVVLMDEKLVKPRTELKKLTTIPIKMAPMNGVPWRGFSEPNFNIAEQSQYLYEWTSMWGRPIFWANRKLYKDLDRLLGYEGERSRKTAKGKYVAKTAGGAPIFSDPSEFTDAEIVYVDAELQEDMRALESPSMPREALELIEQIFSMTQRAGLNRLALGDLNIEVSGVTLERAIASALYVLGPYAIGAQEMLGDISLSFFEQARGLGLKRIPLETLQESKGADMAYMVEPFGKEDIPETTHVQVTLPLLLPDNKMTQATIARQLIPGNQPLMDLQSVAEEHLGVQDWTTVRERIKENLLDFDPRIQAIETMASIRRRIDDYEKRPGMESSADQLRKMLVIMEAQFAQLTEPQQQEEPGAGNPSPQVNPPEATGDGSSNDEVTGDISSTIPAQGLRQAVRNIRQGRQ